MVFIANNKRKEAEERMKEMVTTLEEHKKTLEKIQNNVADIIETKENSKAIQTAAVIVATIANGFDTNTAKLKVLELANEIIKTQR